MDIADQVRKFITSNFYMVNPAALGSDESLLDTGVIDSTGVLEVISFVETTFELTVDEADIIPENLDSIARIAAFVTRKREARAA